MSLFPATFTISQALQDLAIDLRGEGFNWRWETFSTGPKQSADVLSKHLILPLLSTAYLAFISPDAISEISTNDLEKVRFPALLEHPRFQFGAGLTPVFRDGRMGSAQGYALSGIALHQRSTPTLYRTNQNMPSIPFPLSQ